jgi:hypothetical protein
MLAVFAALVGTACGGRKQNLGQSGPVKEFPKAACDTLTEAEVAQFVKFLPTFDAVLTAHKWVPGRADTTKGTLGALSPLVEGMNVRGLKDSLKAIGSNWGKFRATLYKVLAARLIVEIPKRMPKDLVSKMSQDTASFVQKKYADYLNVQSAAQAIPAANLELVKKYEQELNALRALGHAQPRP